VTTRRDLGWRFRNGVKRCFDLSVACVGMAVLSPLFLALGCMVVLTMGRPVLLRQARLGYQGRPFVLYKFRTMKDLRDETGEPLPDEQRLTRLGRFLRHTALDELPELFNVLRGDLSIVGPRPLLPDYRHLYTPEQWRRHDVRPGMAGPVMAKGRNALAWEEKFWFDVWYADNWSLRLDFQILAESVWKLVKGEGARAPGHATMPRFEVKERKAERTVNVLFTSAGRRVELLRAFKRAYADLNLGGSVVAVDVDPLAPSLQVADRRYVVPRIGDPAYIGALLDICRTEKIDLVIPLIDPDVPVLAGYRRQLEATGARVLVLPDAAVETTGDKRLTCELFRELGVPVPRTWSVEEVWAAHPAFPLFVKSRFGSAGRDGFKVRNERELSFFLEYVPDPIVQEFLPGPEITNDVVCDFSGTVLAVVSRERIEVRSGEVAKGKTIYDPRVIDCCVTIAKGLEAVGPITVQCLLRETGNPYFTEVNPRFGGGLPLSIAAGVPVPGWLLALSAGLPIEAPVLGTYERGVFLTRFDDSFILEREEERFAARHHL
jgi:carbamoyl-phosphate synthase large subunit